METIRPSELIENKKPKQNCFALVFLYKILIFNDTSDFS